jgi:type III pantothenate kinase
MNLVVDIGNTKVKAAVFESNTLISFESFEESNFESIIANFLQEYNIKACILSSVKNDQPEICKILEQIPYFIKLNHTTPIPFINQYSTPTTLGIDRIALVAGATDAYPNQNALIIDAGTCITYDFINENQEYLGGAISPGIQIRYRSVHDYTSKLPKLEAAEGYSLIGDSTESAIHSGILNGVVQEIQGVINQYQAKYSDLTVILTGGDTKFLSKQLKNSIFAHQNFLLQGLNRILTFNNKE